jgi:FHA domain
MSEGSVAPRPSLPRRSRKRWAAAGAVAVCWLVLLDVTGSAIAATMLFALLAGLGVVAVLALRAVGLTRDHPWVQKMAARPWRDGQDVLRLALRHLPEVFVVTPSGSLLAPDVVELRLNPDDLDSLSKRMDPGLVSESAAEVYSEQVAARGARLAGRGPVNVRVIADPSVPQGRYRVRQGQPVDASPVPWFHSIHVREQHPGAELAASEFMRPVAEHPGAAHPGREHPGAAHPGAEHPGAEHPCRQLSRSAAQPAFRAPQPAHAESGPAYAGPHPVRSSPYPGFAPHDGNTRSWPEPGRAGGTGTATVIELSRSPVPVLRLVTDDWVAETRVSGARAGRGAVELVLPEVPTVSREHARFTFSDGRWWIANLGKNGLTLNGAALADEQPLCNGDSIRWGMRSDALLSRVEID